MKLQTIVASLLLVGVAAGPQAQSLGDLAKKTAAERAAREKAGAPPPKPITSKDLKESPTDPSEPVIVSGDPKTQEALAALRAVQSVLDGGANTSEFKRYYLEAKVKIDALPNAPGTAALRTISNLYADAITLTIATQVREMSGAEVSAFKTRYATDYDFLEFFGTVPNEGFGERTFNTRTELERSVISSRAGAQLLLIRASAKLRALKTT